MKNYLLLAFFCLIAISCKKQTNDFTVTPVFDPENKSNIVDGTLSFKSIDELIVTWGFLSKLSTNERKKWEEAHGFCSIKRRTEEGFTAIHKANIAESEEMLNKALLDYADVIELRGDTYTPIFDNGPYDLVCNLRRIIIFPKYVQKVNFKKIEIYDIKDFDDLNHGIEKAPIKSFLAVSELFTKSLPTYLQAEYFDNLSGCKNDRRVYVTASHYVGFVSMMETNPNYPQGFWFMNGISGVNAEVYGTERNWLCNWSRYSTILSYRNASFTANGYQNSDACDVQDPVWYPHATSSTIVPFTVTHSYFLTTDYYTTTSETQSLIFLAYFGYRMLNEGLVNDDMVNNYRGFISAHFEGSSRGVSGHWAVIDYN
jgi:hypothetical protein